MCESQLLHMICVEKFVGLKRQAQCATLNYACTLTCVNVGFFLIAVHLVARLAIAAACEDPLASSHTLGLSARSQYMLVYVSINPQFFVNQ